MDFSKFGGLIPAVVQDDATGDVLMVGFMNQEAWDITRQTGYVTFYSRTRNKLWTKGETSGNRLAVRDILIDCDEDTVLVKAECLGDAICGKDTDGGIECIQVCNDKAECPADRDCNGVEGTSVKGCRLK